jgi:hypothetical protein
MAELGFVGDGPRSYQVLRSEYGVHRFAYLHIVCLPLWSFC